MEPECRSITKEMIPAVRAYLAEVLTEKYHYKQAEVAKKLGIAQVAVSKYINMHYSKSVVRAKAEIEKHIAGTQFVKEIIESKSPDDVNQRIERLCEEIIYA